MVWKSNSVLPTLCDWMRPDGFQLAQSFWEVLDGLFFSAVRSLEAKVTSNPALIMAEVSKVRPHPAWKHMNQMTGSLPGLWFKVLSSWPHCRATSWSDGQQINSSDLWLSFRLCVWWRRRWLKRFWVRPVTAGLLIQIASKGFREIKGSFEMCNSAFGSDLQKKVGAENFMV